MANRVTIADVARAAAVSVATVDRVMNKRHAVREATAKRVFEAATQIGYHAANVIGARLQQDLPMYRVGILLQRPHQSFYQALARTLEQQARRGSASNQFNHRFSSTETDFSRAWFGGFSRAFGV